MAQALKSRLKTKDNVHYQLRHCELCARHNEACPQRGTLHGEIKQLFQPNALLVRLIKKGVINPKSALAKIPLLFGSWQNEMVVSNLITSAGKAGMASRANGSGAAAAFTSIGMGTGTNAAAVGDTALQTGVGAGGSADSGVHVLATASVTASRVTTSVTNDTAQLQGTVSITGTIAVTESGVFNADTNGTLLCRQVFSAINVVNGDSLQLTWKVQMS